MTINFHLEKEVFVFQDSSNREELIERETEIRFDPLTGETSRIVFDPGLKPTPPDYTEISEASKGENCPFCPENVKQMTPIFSQEIHSVDRIEVGEAIVFPNLFPYSQYNGVVVFSGEHYIKLEDFSQEIIANAFECASLYLKEVVEKDADIACASINWNYLPYSGSSILHPHLHVIASKQPTNYQANVLRGAKAYFKKHGENFYLQLLKKEEKINERLVKKGETLSWLHAFAPKSHLDFMGIFPEVNSLAELTLSHLQALAKDLAVIFRYFNQEGLASFNMILNIPIKETPMETAHLRIIPRLVIGGMDTSDFNFFQSLHQEPLSYKIPEKVTEKVKKLFTD